MVIGSVQRVGRAQLHLHLLGRALADQQVVLALQVGHHGLVHLVAGHAHRLGIDDAGQRDHRDVRGPAADVDHHVAARFGDRQPGADRRHHRLLHEMDLAGLGAVGRIHDRALLHLGDLRRHADHNPRMHHALAVVVRLHDEVVQHLLGVAEVGDHAVLHRLDGDDVARRAAEHLFGLFAYRLHLVGLRVDRDNGGLVDHDALALRVDQRVGRPKIDGKVVRK
jgi:hypothetical protein